MTAATDEGELVVIVDTESHEVVGRVTLASAETVDFGVEPEGIAVTPGGRRVLVVEGEAYDLRVIDAASETIVGTTPPVGEAPRNIAIADVPDGRPTGMSGCNLRPRVATGNRLEFAIALLLGFVRLSVRQARHRPAAG